MKVWIVERCLTEGIVEADAYPAAGNSKMVCCKNNGFSEFYTMGKNCFLDRVSAVNKARLMKDAKLSSLERGIERIKKLEFK